MFKKFETKKVVREAIEVLESDKIIASPIVNYSDLRRGDVNVRFAHSDPFVKTGDFIIRENEKDVYHCPREVFMEKYQEPAISGLTFGEAIEAAKEGKKIARAGWNGKGMFLILTSMIEFETKADLSDMAYRGVDVPSSFVMYTAQDTFVVGWLASQTDMLVEDWCVVE